MPITPYTTNIPLATQPINQTQQAINDNFTCLVNNATPANGLITVNHVGTNDPVDYGKHFFIQMPEGVPTVATGATEIGLYCKDGATSLVAELYFQRESGAADSGTPMTEYVVNNAGSTNGFTWLPSGMKIIWGSAITNNVTGNATVTYAVAVPGFPGFSTNWTGPQLTTSNATGLSLTALSGTAFSVHGGNNVTFYWSVIGF